MDTAKHHYTLEQLPADRRMIEQLFVHGRISGKAREHALEFIHPHDQWSLWASRLLLLLGTTLVLSGLIYFFAFNWAEIPPMAKLFGIEGGIIACLTGAYIFSLKHLSGQIALLSASVLVGVFMAVFGQIYQTGADAYQLFMMWSLLTLGWTIISGFAAQWLFWLVITNVFVALWWEQAFLPERGEHLLIFNCMALLNGVALTLRELAVRRYSWLEPEWTRTLPAIATLFFLLVPVEVWIVDKRASTTETACVLLGLLGHAILFFTYRYKFPSMWGVSATVLSICIMVETACFHALFEVLDKFDSAMLLVMGMLTIGIFTAAIIYLRTLVKTLENTHEHTHDIR